MTWDSEESNAVRPTAPLKGRGAASYVTGRFATTAAVGVDDGWASVYEDPPGRPQTTVTEERARTVISRNDSPDIGFSQSVNPYKGCEHVIRTTMYLFTKPTRPERHWTFEPK